MAELEDGEDCDPDGREQDCHADPGGAGVAGGTRPTDSGGKDEGKQGAVVCML